MKSRRGIQPRQYGFTLIEVMIALAILAVALIGLIGRTATNIRVTQEMSMVGVAAELARSKMYDLEAQLLQEGFQELDQSSDGDFSDEGWPEITWEAKVEKVELPNLNTLNSLENAGGEGEQAGSAGGGILGSVLGGGMLGGAAPGDMADASFLSSQFEMIRQVLEVAIRKVTLTVRYKSGNEQKELVVACYFTDPESMDKVLMGLGSSEPVQDPSGGSGGGPQPSSGGGGSPQPGSGSGTPGRTWGRSGGGESSK